jgi:hypothetical protein
MQADTPSTNGDPTDHRDAQTLHRPGDQGGHSRDHPLWLTIAEYAEHVGLSQSAIRRKIRRGELAAELVEGPYGQEYRIWLGDQAAHHEQRGWPPDDDLAAHRGDQPDYQPASGLGELVALVERQQQTILELSGRCGWLQSENRQLLGRVQNLEEQVTLLSPPTQNGYQSGNSEPIANPPPSDGPSPPSAHRVATETCDHSARSASKAGSAVQKDSVGRWWAFRRFLGLASIWPSQ